MIAYFDCFSGISGDMIIGAFLDAGVGQDILKKELSRLKLPDLDFNIRKVSRTNVAATKFDIISDEQKSYRHLKDLNAIVEGADLDARLKAQAKDVFLTLATAEAKIHGVALEKVHFHEVGAVDTIVDVVGGLICLRLLNIEKVVCSKLNLGTGFVTFSHGVFPVPAPATAEILKGMPTYATDSQAELVTPTGAAFLAVVADEFGEMPVMKTERIGYGAGTNELKQPNVLRVFIGEALTNSPGLEEDVISVIETNIDDLNPQIFDHLMEKLFLHGVLDVYLTPVMMKKNRPGTQVSVLIQPQDEQKISELIFRETSSIGVRIRQEKRRKLPREIRTVETAFGEVAFKIATLNGQVVNAMPEYEDCKRIAREKNLSLKSVYSELNKIMDFK